MHDGAHIYTCREDHKNVEGTYKDDYFVDHPNDSQFLKVNDMLVEKKRENHRK